MQKLFYILSILIILNINAEPDLDFSLPELGDRVSGVVSNDQEKIIGNEFLKQVYSQAPLISDPLIQEYSELLVYRLSEYSQVKDRNFNVLLIDDDSLNAFAAPGGVIGINGGLFLNAQNEGQFASVITHELAHLSQRHFARNILNSQDNNIASVLVMVSAVAAAVATNNPTAFMAGPAFLQQQSLRYSRLFEREADRVGFNNLINAEYDPSSMGEMFEQMAKLRRLAGDKIPEFLLTHPISSSRVTDAFNAADQVEAPEVPEPIQYASEHPHPVQPLDENPNPAKIDEVVEPKPGANPSLPVPVSGRVSSEEIEIRRKWIAAGLGVTPDEVDIYRDSPLRYMGASAATARPPARAHAACAPPFGRRLRQRGGRGLPSSRARRARVHLLLWGDQLRARRHDR